MYDNILNIANMLSMKIVIVKIYTPDL